MCGDCGRSVHFSSTASSSLCLDQATKLLIFIHRSELTVRDPNRNHLFTHDSCSENWKKIDGYWIPDRGVYWKPRSTAQTAQDFAIYGWLVLVLNDERAVIHGLIDLQFTI